MSDRELRELTSPPTTKVMMRVLHAFAVLVVTSCASHENPPPAGPEPEPDAAMGKPEELPHVAFVEPQPGAVLGNPVTFVIASRGVDEIEVFADEKYSLAPAWDPSVKDRLRYRFAGTGVSRKLHVVGRAAGIEVARADLTITVTPDSCEERFFVDSFDARNVDPSKTIDVAALREDALTALEAEVAGLQACGADVTLGGMMALLLYEGGLRLAAFNTRCSENSYNNTTANCDAVAEALYSYQFGLGAIHTSNFHPCKGGAYTQGMRQAFVAALASAGFSTTPAISPALTTRFKTVCPSANPTAVDYYLLDAHDVFGIPRNTAGNHLAGYGQFPLFSPKLSIALTFRALRAACSSIASNRDAIRIFGGADVRYAQAAKQDEILGLYTSYAAANCQ